MDDRRYNELFGTKCLNEVIDGYIAGEYNFSDLKLYLDWNEFTLNDIDFQKIYAERLKKAVMKRRGQ